MRKSSRKAIAKANEKDTINYYFPQKKVNEKKSREDFLKDRLNDLQDSKEEKKCECYEKLQQIEIELEIARKKIEQLELLNSELKMDCKQLKKMYVASNEVNLHKDIKIEKLEKHSCPEEDQKIFSKFAINFDESTLSNFRKITPGKSHDSTIVNKCICSLYEHNILELLKIGVTNKNGKKVISPQKKKVISEVLTERVQFEETTTEEFNQRIATTKINEHIRYGIKNIVQSKFFKDLLVLKGQSN